MKQLLSHLSKLLIHHECVIVPSLGGFVARKEEAHIDPTTGLMRAPRRVVGFNPSLSHNDGLLTEAIMRHEKISFELASQSLKQQTDQMIQRIAQGETITIDHVGALYNKESILIFIPQISDSINRQHFGLTEIRLRKLSHNSLGTETSHPQVETKEKSKYVSIHRATLRAISVAASIIIAATLFFAQQGERVDKSTLQQATFIPTPSIESVITPPTTNTPQETVSATPFIPIAPSATTKKHYYTMVDCSSSAFAAQRRVEQLHAMGYNEAGFIKLYGKIGVYIEENTIYAVATQGLKVTQAEIEPTSWIYCAK